MDTFSAVDVPRDDAAARQRFESFKLGKGLPSSFNMAQRHGSHHRSHSRNASFSSSMSSVSASNSSGSLSSSTSSNDRSSFTMNSSANPTGSTKRHSHHRRKSSVSTRHESAEMMGVAVPDLPPSTSDDNVNFGEKDSIRRRALWALEGKPDMAFSKVEIPELSSPDLVNKLFDFAMATKGPFVPGQGTFGAAGGSLTGSTKRDSFKLLAPSSSLKDQLHTLVEEEEEEEEVRQEPTPPPESPEISESTTAAPVVAVTKPSPVRPRPATLNLKPLSLTPESLGATHGLPTPSLTPSPRAGLKALALGSANFPPSPTEEVSSQSMRQSLILTPSPTPSLSRRILPGSISDSPSPQLPTDDVPKRRSSISYKRSSSSSAGIGLPTPEQTPITERRFSVTSSSSGEDEFFPRGSSRPLSTSEQHFLVKSHNALLSRITDLERALSSRGRMRSRPVSCASDASSDGRPHSPSMSVSSTNEPNDEMLQLIADLKSERDELKKDVDGWRTRVANLEKQIGVFAKRVENERREAWVARSRVGLLEVEKANLEKNIMAKTAELEEALQGCDRLRTKLTELEEEYSRLKVEADRATAIQEECDRLKEELRKERERREEIEREHAEMLATPTPRAYETCIRPMLSRKRPSYTSIDSASSATDVESVDESKGFNFPLKPVEEVEEEYLSEEDNPLARYEDEEDSDLSFQSPDESSSFGSEDEYSRSIAHLQPDVPGSPMSRYSTPSSSTPTMRSRSTSPSMLPTVSEGQKPTHVSRASLSKTWTFPKGVQVVARDSTEVDEVDKFFGCFEDGDASPPLRTLGADYTYEASKNRFAQGFAFAENEDPPFLLPRNIGTIVSMSSGLEAVVEEEEEEEEEAKDETVDEEVFGEIGGITITFTPAEEEDTSDLIKAEPEPTIKSSPIFFGEEDDEGEEPTVPFNFGRPLSSVSVQTPKRSPLFSAIPRPVSPSSVSQITSPPSSIPRPILSKLAFNPQDVVTSTPPRSTPIKCSLPAISSCNTFVTPPTKRGGVMPSFIPQPVSSPSPIRNVTSIKPRVVSTSSTTFVRQPPRRPLMPSSKQVSVGASGLNTNGSTFKPQSFGMTNVCRSSDVSNACPASVGPASTMLNDSVSCPSVNQDNLSSRHPIFDAMNFRPPQTQPFSSSPSIMTSSLVTRISTFTSFNPFSWATRGVMAASDTAIECMQPDSSRDGPDHSGSAKAERPGYVSREKQLAKLRNQLECDGLVSRTSVNSTCMHCKGEEVVV